MNKEKRVFKEAGILIGFAIAFVFLITTLTGNIAIAIPVGVALAILFRKTSSW